MFGFGPEMIFRIPAMLIALTVHEYAHARVAVMLGDNTPRIAGRLTLNPIAHLDPVGLIMLWIARFGWAKPVPVNPYNLRYGSNGMLMVSLAGAAANLVTAVLAIILVGILNKFNLANDYIQNILTLTYFYNLIFAVFNMIPIPPLDGAKIVSSLLPGRLAYAFERIAPYSFFILIALMYLGIIGMIINPIIDFLDLIISTIVSFII